MRLALAQLKMQPLPSPFCAYCFCLHFESAQERTAILGARVSVTPRAGRGAARDKREEGHLNLTLRWSSEHARALCFYLYQLR